MKEEEAKKKWCPATFGCGCSTCIGSDCMAWRKEKDNYGDDYGKDIPDDLGYCGLAGRI